MEIRVLARQGQSIRAIGREMGLSKNTVKRQLRKADGPLDGPCAKRPTKLDAFHDYLRGRLEAARPHWIPASVLQRELRALGYEGGISQLKLFIGPRKRTTEDPVVRFETPPGDQMQADFTVIRRGRAALLAFVATLGYSRASFVRFTSGEDAQTLRRCLEESFAYFGGVPRTVLFDNPKTVVIERVAYGEGKHRWNDVLLASADTFGFLPRLCRPYRARTKGKVERFNGYLKSSFVVPLAATLRQAGLVLDVTTANTYIGPWLQEVANTRVHATTGEVPLIRLQQELPMFLPLPAFIRGTHAPQIPQHMHTALPVESLQHPLSVYGALLEDFT